jgi:hypothetical protein
MYMSALGKNRSRHGWDQRPVPRLSAASKVVERSLSTKILSAYSSHNSGFSVDTPSMITVRVDLTTRC